MARPALRWQLATKVRCGRSEANVSERPKQNRGRAVVSDVVQPEHPGGLEMDMREAPGLLRP